MRLAGRHKSRWLKGRGGTVKQASVRTLTHMPGCQDTCTHTYTEGGGKKKYKEKVTPSPSNITMPSPGVKAPSEGLVHSSGQKNKKKRKRNGSFYQKRKSRARDWPEKGRTEQEPSHACLARELASTPGGWHGGQPPRGRSVGTRTHTR